MRSIPIDSPSPCLVVPFGAVVETLGVEEVHHWRWTFKNLCLASLADCSLLCVCGWWCDFLASYSGGHAPACCYVFPAFMDSVSLWDYKPK